MPRKLKVFRMPIGFEDAYVAAPSRKAALEAWGAEHDQFARGVAEEVTDEKLMEEPLAHPGEVIRKSRGDLASQLKALPPRPAKASKPGRRTPAIKPAKPAPPPRRDKLDAAEAALKDAQKRQQEVLAKLERERKAIESRIEALQSAHGKELAKLTRKRDDARTAYRQALDEWSG